MEEHDEVIIFYQEEPHGGSYDAVFAIIDHAGRNTVEMEERKGSLDAQKVDKSVLHTLGKRTRGGGRRLKLTLSELGPDESDMIRESMQYE